MKRYSSIWAISFLWLCSHLFAAEDFLSTEPATFLESLAVPTPPPPNITLPNMLYDGQQWRGSQCGVTRPGTKVFRNESEWHNFWSQAMAPYASVFKTTPTIDFSKFMVVAVFRGELPQPIYEIDISSVAYETKDDQTRLTVSFTRINHFMGIDTPRFAVQPFHLKTVPRFDGAVRFADATRKHQL